MVLPGTDPDKGVSTCNQQTPINSVSISWYNIMEMETGPRGVNIYAK